MRSGDGLQASLDAAMSGAGRGLSAANQLCVSCVEVLDVDGAAISWVRDGASQGTFGSSGSLSRRLDELQFTFGEGPCLDAVVEGRPVLVPDLRLENAGRWPALTGAMLDQGIRAVFALPVSIAAVPVAAIDLFRRSPGPLSPEGLDAGVHASRLAVAPLLDLLQARAGPRGEDGAETNPELKSLERVEVYQAIGMIMAQLDVDTADALARLRAYAYAHDHTASEVAWAVVQRRLTFDRDDLDGHGDGGRS